jgi:hypothetical protein
VCMCICQLSIIAVAWGMWLLVVLWFVCEGILLVISEEKKKPEDFEKRQGKRPRDTCVSDGTRCTQFVVGCFADGSSGQASYRLWSVGGTEQESKAACDMLVITNRHILLNCRELYALHLTRRTCSASWARHAQGNPAWWPEKLRTVLFRMRGNSVTMRLLKTARHAWKV